MSHLIELLQGRRRAESLTVQSAMRLLGGLGKLYGLLMQQRAQLYKEGWLSVYHPPCPVVSVGNLSAGGTGKTPMVLWLAQQLLPLVKELAIISRGYGSTATRQEGIPSGISLVADAQGIHLHPPQAADEATLLAHSLPQVAILTGKERRLLIEYAYRQLGSRMLLLDDAFQHLRVHRDLNLVLLDAQLPFGNGAILPGGILREAPQALQRADALIVTRCRDQALFHQAQQQLRPFADDKPILCCDHRPLAWQQPGVASSQPLDLLRHTPVLAFCGIARPDSFAQLLQESGCKPLALRSFPDHYPFTQQTLQALQQQGQRMQAQALVCTEKDASKINPAWLNAQNKALPLFALRMELHWPEQPLWLLKQLHTLSERLTPPDGALRPPT
ncbi:tetraacyldisaccharide 4'-kinase [Candidatus Magnetaquicoccus inordinatus]|uniref:tetraacyldisaccharide 4'-kinase n=1 Tax=Candidatus Magnetaquicoccus inordinatus TaxID=2496818 RepID=UPI00102CBE1F|nr:tetraacyldisaccharide 4'-kinase [Candidatus Magnetaquicoccus inordinatus]